MPRDGTATREKILDAAEALILDHGYSGMSVDNLLEHAEITKGAFFYHFKSKADLAKALIDRYAARDQGHTEEVLNRASQLSRDPLQRLLIFVGLYVELMGELNDPFPGCLYAAYCYQSGLMQPEVMRVVSDTMIYWRRRIAGLIDKVKEKYPPRVPVDSESLADHLLVTFEGAFVLSKTLNEPKLTARQLEHYRNYLEVLFVRDAAAGARSVKATATA